MGKQFTEGRDWLWGLLLVFGVILIYLPVWQAGFIWDDDEHITNNPCIVGPLGLKEIWTTHAARICPLVLTTFWLEHALWGLRPLPYHLVNIFMHAGCAVVLWRVLRSLRIPGAWLGAALWAMHPVQVESVAWITELKNTQSCLFYLLSVFFFVKWLRTEQPGDRNEKERDYKLTLLFAALAMASKSSTVVLPIVLCLCAWWVEGRWQRRNLASIGPIFFMSMVAGIVSIWTQKVEGANDLIYMRSLPERLITAGNVFWFYLGKLVWPHPLIFIYPRWVIDAGLWLSYLPVLLATILLTVLWFKRQSWARPCFFAVAYFLVALFPVLGLVDHYFLRYSFVGDHFQYLASIGPLALAGAALAKLADFVWLKQAWLQSSLCGALLLVLGLVSWQRTWVYESLDTLWTDTLAQNPGCWLVHYNVGLALAKKGQLDEAIAHFQQALEGNPKYAQAHNNWGMVLLQKGQSDEAMGQFQISVEIDPANAQAHINLGNVLFMTRDVSGAIAEYQKALKIKPYLAGAHNNLGLALAHDGRWNEAIAQFQEALRWQPNFSDALNNLAKANQAAHQNPSGSGVP